MGVLLCCVGGSLLGQTAAPSLGAGASSVPVPPLSTSGSVEGSVTGPGGALVSGARVTLYFPGGAESRHTVSDSDGRFRFESVPAGAISVTVRLQGFDPCTSAAALEPDQHLQLAPLALRLSTVTTEVDAVASPEDLAIEQVHAEEKQRLFGALPNFFVSYTWHAAPLSSRQKFSLATKNVFDPGNLLLVGALAGEQQAQNAFAGYGQGAQGYGKRYGAGLGNLVAGTYMGGAVLPSLFRQDPRYFYKGTGSVKSRFLYAVSRAVICRGDNGKSQPAFASVLGDLSAGAISNLYYAPSDRQGATLTVENGFLGIAGDALNNVFQEFILKKLTTKVREATSNTAP